jgi:hypothetical protein
VVVLAMSMSASAGCAAGVGTGATTSGFTSPSPRAFTSPLLDRLEGRDFPPSTTLPYDIASALERRLTELEERGGTCALYGEVLERSYREGRIALRPFMWRVGGRLASGQATADGAMILAREIDPLNVGVRTVDDVVRSMEHEAVHIALRVADATGGAWHDPADRHVQECREAGP